MTAERLARIRTALETALQPSALTVLDDSAAHEGHPGAREGGHFRVSIVSGQFRGQPVIARHKLVYRAVQELIGRDIHALSIEARTPEETT